MPNDFFDYGPNPTSMTFETIEKFREFMGEHMSSLQVASGQECPDTPWAVFIRITHKEVVSHLKLSPEEAFHVAKVMLLAAADSHRINKTIERAKRC